MNRRALIQQLEHAVTLADRQQGEFALLFLDLDKFKGVNDSYGHESGDELLRQVAARLTAAVRVSDVVARLGGDEFVVLVEGKGAAANAARVAKKIAQAHARPYAIGRHQIRTSSSIGIGLYPQDGASAQLLMKHADLAMYHAKQHERGSISFFHEAFNAREAERERWRQELRAALDGDQLELHYQPSVDIASGAVHAVEAQLHWRHPRLGLIGAPAWQADVPDLALLEQLDDWSIGAACAQAAQWRAGALAAPRIGINLMSAQLQPDLAQKIATRMQRHRLGAGSIGVELPEPLLNGTRHADAVLRQLRAAGVSVSVDHFGRAGAALAVCQTLALDQLKIDRGFIAAIGNDAGGTDMAAAIILLARALSLDTVALGVQTAAQLAVLAGLGCRHYQGELYSAALPADALQQKLRQAAPAAA